MLSPQKSVRQWCVVRSVNTWHVSNVLIDDVISVITQKFHEIDGLLRRYWICVKNAFISKFCIQSSCFMCRLFDAYLTCWSGAHVPVLCPRPYVKSIKLTDDFMQVCWFWYLSAAKSSFRNRTTIVNRALACWFYTKPSPSRNAKKLLSSVTTTTSFCT